MYLLEVSLYDLNKYLKCSLVMTHGSSDELSRHGNRNSLFLYFKIKDNFIIFS